MEQSERALAMKAFKMDLRTAVKNAPDKYEYVVVTAENAAKVIEWVIFHTEGAYTPKANYGDVVVRNLWDDSFEVWDGPAFEQHFNDIPKEQ